MPVVANFVAFKAGWLSSVLGGANQMPWLGPLAVAVAVLIHLSMARRPQTEIALILACGAIGTVFDSILVAAGWVSYPSGMFSQSLAPYWIIGMWMLFATTLNMSLSFLKGKPVLAFVMGFVAGPLAYLGGAKLGGMIFENQFAALAMLAVGWGVMMPGLMALAGRFDGMTAAPVAAAETGS
ncbi:MAG: DUF2878 domain-containing protein [Woeseiaceae bacterium]|nr:DUF2878 domain-containing protein [Woeseiaceae bacterium]